MADEYRGRRCGEAVALWIACLLALAVCLEPCSSYAAPDSTDVTPWTQAKPGAPPKGDTDPPAVAVPAPTAGPPDEAVIELTGGSVKGAIAGQGTASVKARVTSHGARKLLGVRIAAYYDVIDALPAPDARWHLHEFLFEPPLTAGAGSDVAFSDEDGGQYVLLKIVYARFALGIAADGAAVMPAQSELLERDGVPYIAARDLGSALHAQLRPGEKKQVMLSRGKQAGHNALSLVYSAGQVSVIVGGAGKTWAHPPFEQAGRGYLPLQEACGLLGYDADYDAGTNVLTLAPK